MSYNINYGFADNMEYSVSSNDFKKDSECLKKSDRGYNIIWRMIQKNGRNKRSKIEIYTSGNYGSHIRDAESGEYYKHIVGTSDEDLYFSVIIATGECKSSNGSITLFYISPEHYMKHQHRILDTQLISKWEARRDDTLNTLTLRKR